MGSRAVLISGTGRSGTSITAEMIARLGVRMLHSGRMVEGGPNNANPTGTWEDKGLADLTEAWARGNPERRVALTAQLLTVCRERCRSWPAWGFKDPRITEAASLWGNASAQLVEEGFLASPPLLIITERDQEAVLRSLELAYSMPPGLAEEWLELRLAAKTVLEAQWVSRGWPIWWVSFTQLVRAPLYVASEAYDRLVEGGHMAGIEGHERLTRIIQSVDHITPENVRSGGA